MQVVSKSISFTIVERVAVYVMHTMIDMNKLEKLMRHDTRQVNWNKINNSIKYEQIKMQLLDYRSCQIFHFEMYKQDDLIRS